MDSLVVTIVVTALQSQKETSGYNPTKICDLKKKSFLVSKLILNLIEIWIRLGAKQGKNEDWYLIVGGKKVWWKRKAFESVSRFNCHIRFVTY